MIIKKDESLRITAETLQRIRSNPGPNARDIELGQFWENIPEEDHTTVLLWEDLLYAERTWEENCSLLDEQDIELLKLDKLLKPLLEKRNALLAERAKTSAAMSAAHEKKEELKVLLRS